MRKVYVSAIIDRPVHEVWAVLGDFHRIDSWAQIIHESTPEDGMGKNPVVGSIRRLTVGEDRRTLRERLVAYDPGVRQMCYELTGPILPFGMTLYLATVHVLPVTETNTTFVEWSGDYECPDSDEVARVEAGLSGSYTRFLGDLRAHLDVQGHC